MTINPRAIAVLGVGYVAIALATMGLIVPAEPANTAGVGAADAVQIVTHATASQVTKPAAVARSERCKSAASVEMVGAVSYVECAAVASSVVVGGKDVFTEQSATSTSETVAKKSVSIELIEEGTSAHEYALRWRHDSTAIRSQAA